MVISAPETSADFTPSASVFKPFAMPGGYTNLLERWSDVVAEFGPRPAYVSRTATYTFAEADRLSDLVALSILDALDPADQNPIAVLGGQTADVLVTLLAVIKTGRLHVVVDAHLPAERHRQILGLAGTTTLLFDAAHADAATALTDSVRLIIQLETLLDEAKSSSLSEAELSSRKDVDLAFGRSRGGRDGFGIVFTSGSTGKPKGVIQTHDEFLNQVMIQQTANEITPEDRCLLAQPLGFVAGLDAFLSLPLNGASVWCFDVRDEGMAALIEWIDQNRLTTFMATPFLARSIGEALEPGRVLSSLRFVWTGGEAVTGRDIGIIRSYLEPASYYINCTGSSEAAVLALWKLPNVETIPDGTIPSGQIAVNKSIRILREDGQDAAPGETGLVAIVSDYISAGYWNDPAKTAASFKVDAAGRRYFLQGDLGRIDANGDLVLGGRADAAVKVRGYLVEPAEVESAILTLPELADAVVVASPLADGSQRLVAYVVPQAGLRAPSSAAIRRALRDRIPEYMVPGALVQLTALPRTERGKIDRTALPPVPPRVVDVTVMDQHELAMSTIWQEVLELPGVGLDDDFMAIGGDSLSAEELLTIVQERFGVILPSTEMIQFPTLREFTARVFAGGSALPSHPDIVTLNATGTETPVFAVPGAGALALTFLPLSRRLSNAPFFAFQAHGLEARGIPDWSVEATADRNISLMRIVRPHGPYRLVGHSYGGLITMEMAQKLRAAGEDVELLVLLDTHLFARGSGRLRTLDDSPVPEGLRSTVPTREPLLSRLIRRVMPDGLPHGEMWGRQFRAYTAGIVRHDGKLLYDSFLDQATLLGRRYDVKPYDGRVLLVQAEGNPQEAEIWDDILVGDVETVTTKAEHTSLLREPEVAETAGIIGGLR